MFKKLKLNSAIKKSKKEIAFLEQKRSRSQAALVTAILSHTDPDDEDVDYFNHYTGLIENERNNLHKLEREFDELNAK